MKNEYKKIISLILWYLPVALIQFVSAQITFGSINPWYRDLVKAWWTPPAWVFGPAWTVLYAMMAIAAWMVYHAKAASRQRSLAYVLFFAQLFANGLWSFLFFGLHRPEWALIDLGLLIFLIAMTGFYFYRIRPLAGLLLLPYLIWSIYAFTLNAAIWRLN